VKLAFTIYCNCEATDSDGATAGSVSSATA
jgi:hypothetical protein